MEAKETHTRTTNSTTSDREPSTSHGQGMANWSTTRLATVRERAHQARGLGALTGRLWVGVLASDRRRPCASGQSRAWGAVRERFASTQAMRMQFGKL
eukprot:1542897-Pleurochrysis_carterae.AAC.1